MIIKKDDNNGNDNNINDNNNNNNAQNTKTTNNASGRMYILSHLYVKGLFGRIPLFGSPFGGG